MECSGFHYKRSTFAKVLIASNLFIPIVIRTVFNHTTSFGNIAQKVFPWKKYRRGELRRHKCCELELKGNEKVDATKNENRFVEVKCQYCVLTNGLCHSTIRRIDCTLCQHHMFVDGGIFLKIAKVIHRFIELMTLEKNRSRC